MKNTWWRMGVTIPMTDEEIAVLKNGNSADVRDLLMRKWKSGEVTPDGECYMPECCAEDIGIDNCWEVSL